MGSEGGDFLQKKRARVGGMFYFLERRSFILLSFHVFCWKRFSEDIWLKVISLHDRCEKCVEREKGEKKKEERRKGKKKS